MIPVSSVSVKIFKVSESSNIYARETWLKGYLNRRKLKFVLSSLVKIKVALLKWQPNLTLYLLQVLDALFSEYEKTVQGPAKWQKLSVFLQQRFVRVC